MKIVKLFNDGATYRALNVFYRAHTDQYISIKDTLIFGENFSIDTLSLRTEIGNRAAKMDAFLVTLPNGIV